MTVYCRYCPEKFDAPMGPDLAAEREMYLEHQEKVHNIPEPAIYSFLPWEVNDQTPQKNWGWKK